MVASDFTYAHTQLNPRTYRAWREWGSWFHN